DAIAGVVAHAVGRDAAQGMVQRLDVPLGRLAPRRRVERGVAEQLGEEGIVYLDEEARVDDRLVFGAQGVGDGEQVLLFAGVVGVGAHAAGRHGGHKDLRGLHGGDGGLQVIDVALQRLLAAIAHRAGTLDGRHRHDPAALHGLAEVLLVVLREGLDLRGEGGAARVGLGREAGLALLAVGDDVHAAVDLPAHDVRDGLAHPRIVGGGVHGLAAGAGFHQVEQVPGARQAAAVRGEDALSAVFHGAWPPTLALRTGRARAAAWAALPVCPRGARRLPAAHADVRPGP